MEQLSNDEATDLINHMLDDFTQYGDAEAGLQSLVVLASALTDAGGSSNSSNSTSCKFTTQTKPNYHFFFPVLAIGVLSSHFVY